MVWMPAHLAVRERRRVGGAHPDSISGLGGVRRTALIVLARKTVWEELAPDVLPRPRPARSSPPMPTKRPSWRCARSSLTGSRTRRRTPRADHGLSQLPPQDRLQPALLDRLTDDEPDKKLEPREAACCRSAACGRRCCATSPGCSTPRGSRRATDLANVPHVRRSVRQFRPAGAVGHDGLLARCDRPRPRHPRGDPRLRAAHPAGIAADHGAARAGRLDHHNVIGVEIRGQLWAQPVPLEFLVRTEIDLETGQGRRSPISPRRAGGVMDPRLLRTTTSSCSTCARWARSSPSSSRRSPPGSA